MATSGLTAAAAVDRLSVVLGQRHTLIGPLTGGETGATAISDPNGVQLVLKWEADPTARIRRAEGVVLSERLRTEAGWPVPRQQSIEDDDLTFVTQEFMAGDPVHHLSTALVNDVLALHERRLGLARAGDPDRWGADLIETLVDGGDGYCLHEPLRRYDDRSRRLIARIEELGRSLDVGDLVGSDVVHFDLHAGNLLQIDGRLASVVDLDFTQVGDARFDLTTLAVSSLDTPTDPEARSRLVELVGALPDAPRRAYVAHLVLRILDWPIRKGRTDDVEFWLAQVGRLMPEE